MVKDVKFFSNETQKAIFCEAILSSIIDLILLLCLWFLLILIDIDNITKKYFLIITAFYFTFTVLLNYRIVFLFLVDLAKKNTIKQKVQIIDFKVESSWSGRLWNSNVHLFYPKKKMVDKFKLCYIDENGKKNFVRTVLSIEKRKIIYKLFLDNQNNNYITICYLKNSKILSSFDIPAEYKNDKNFEKAIYQLNKFV